MTACGATGVRSIDDAVSRIPSGPDARILRAAILESIATSPEAFLADAAKLERESAQYWEDRLVSSTWAVLQRGKRIVGIAAAKPPGDTDYDALQEKACFIESIWIAPSMRGKGLGERLVTYLIEQRRKAGLDKFYLWVFEYNDPANRLYNRMNFKPTGQPSKLSDVPEIQYLREFDSAVIDDEELKQNARARRWDRIRRRTKYRLLTAESARTHLLRDRW